MTEPKRSRPIMPEGYGVPETDEGLLDWSWAVERLEAAKNYWFSTTRPDGRPHAMPAWGAWIDGVLYFDGSPETSADAQPGAEPGDLDPPGERRRGGDPRRRELARRQSRSSALAERLAAALATKYGPTYVPTPDTWDEGGLWALRPKVAFGWSEFPKNVTALAASPETAPSGARRPRPAPASRR